MMSFLLSYTSLRRTGVKLIRSSSNSASSTGFTSSMNYGYLRGADVSRKASTDEMLRVDHAGEVAAVEIYRGQAWVLRGTSVEGLLKVRRFSGSCKVI